ncbi:hypothetical protein [Bacillus sp. FJAT-18017]|uniref:hypothetical protein n=1 Tax=Bacillus sp. FJAT-18017 TaxID=1705566 RepID=UPI000AD6C8D8|nr:hypothetical protein [Bacillus sp. FJAT-18017]
MNINKEELIKRASAVLGRDVTHEAIMKTVQSLVERLEKEKAEQRELSYSKNLN